MTPRSPCWRDIVSSLLLVICGSSLFPCDCLAEDVSSPRGDLLLVVGAPGSDDYAEQFRSWATSWQTAATAGRLRIRTLGLQSDDATLEQLAGSLQAAQQEEQLPLWVVLLGHGTFDGRTAKFNLPGEDLTPERFNELLKPLKRPTALILCAAASGPFVEKLSAPGRVVVAATGAGSEINFSRFGRFFASSLQHTEADLDKDQQVSLLETFLRASRLTEEFYAGDGQLATEHACLDDNGDGRPVPASGFDGLRAVQRRDRQGLLPDGVVAHQWILVPGGDDALLSPEVLARRQQLEREIALLQAKKADLPEDAYYLELERLFLKLARLLLPPKE